MFWKLVSNLPLPKHVPIPNVRLRSSINSLAKEQTENNNTVILLGTIVSKVRISSEGVKSVVVRTVEDRDVYSNHVVKVRTDERLPVGERIYVFGFLGSKQFSLDDGRLRQKLTIKSNYIRLRGHEHSVQSKDVNNVKISAQITSNIRTTDKYSLFTLALMHSLKGESRLPGMIITEFHPIIVYDQSLNDMVRNNLKKYDNVQIDGKISYMPYKSADGKTTHGGFIEAQSINRI